MMINTGVSDNNTLHTKLLDILDNNEILKEVKFTTSLINPQFDFRKIGTANKSTELFHS
jgi:hypothetical protein